MADHSVVIAGAGPTGLMLAGELALAGVDVAVVERRPSQELSGARALGRACPIDVITTSGPRGIIGFLYDARPVLLDLAAPSGIDIAPWSDRVRKAGTEHYGEHIDRSRDWTAELIDLRTRPHVDERDP